MGFLIIYNWETYIASKINVSTFGDYINLLLLIKYIQMKKLVLKSKHWVMFLLIIGMPLISHLTISPILLFSRQFKWFATLQLILLVYPTFIYFYWLWTLGTKLPKKLTTKEIKKETIKFKVSMVFPFLFCSVMFFMILIIYSEMLQGDEPPYFFITESLHMIILAYIISIFCIIYSIWLISNSLNKIEKIQGSGTKERFKNLILMILFPIGIWYIQPRINRIYSTH